MRLGLALLLAFTLTIRASPWPQLPPTTYSGTIENKPQGKPEPGARIVAVRPAQKPGLFDDWPLQNYKDREVSIGETLSGKDGRFVLVTKGGYATRLLVETQDHRMTAIVDKNLKHDNASLQIEVLPASFEIEYHVPLSQADVTAFGTICGKIMYDYAATGYSRALAIDGYRVRGIISPDDYATLLRLKPDITGDKPGMQQKWSTMTMRIPAFDEPVRFVGLGKEAEKKWSLLPDNE